MNKQAKVWAIAFLSALGASRVALPQSVAHNELRTRIQGPLHVQVAGQAPGAAVAWELEQSGTTADLRGVHAAGGGVVWASGTHGTVLRSLDAGASWRGCTVPPGGQTLDFRAVWAWDSETAMVMSSGPGAQSRLYRTTDGCAHWTLLQTNTDPQGFWDGLVFSDRQNGFLLGDPVGGSFFVEETTDGGAHWMRIGLHQPGVNGLAADGRGAFAAANSAMALGPGVLGSPGGIIHTVLIGTSGPGGALVLNGGIDCGMETAHTDPDACLRFWTFDPQKTPLAGDSASSGVFSLDFLPGGDPSGAVAVAVGGDYTKPDARAGTAAWWTLATGWQPPRAMPGGYRSSVEYDPALRAWIAAGPNGSDISQDRGRSWQPLERAPAGVKSEWNALSLPWAVGPAGRIGRLSPARVQH